MPYSKSKNRDEGEEQRKREVHSKHNLRWNQRYPEKARAIRNRGDEKLKRDIMVAYGNGEAVCVKCGFDDLRALSLDHIGGGGNAHRHEDGGRFQGRKLYTYLRRNNYPAGYQTLCMNCQWIKRHENKEYGR